MTSVSYGMGSQISSFRQEALRIESKGGVIGFSKVDFEQGDMIHHWVDPREIRLKFYIERPANNGVSSLEFTIRGIAPKGEDNAFSYDGTFEIVVTTPGKAAPKVLKGKASCGAG